jgi:outer membrane lipase/esterase
MPDSFSSLIVLGDSWSDTGNVYKQSQETWPQVPPYYKGRFSNGPVWVEILAKKLNASLYNYAYGGSGISVQGFSGPFGNMSVPSLKDQVALATSQIPLDDTTLIVIWGGGNDYFFNATVKPETIVLKMMHAVHELNAKGATYFMLPLLPDATHVPFIANSSLLNHFAEAFKEQNELLSSFTLEKASDVVILSPQFNETLGKLCRNPSRYRFDSDCSSSCTLAYHSDSVCIRPQKLIFWDEFHFSTRVHSYFAKEALKSIRFMEQNST